MKIRNDYSRWELLEAKAEGIDAALALARGLEGELDEMGEGYAGAHAMVEQLIVRLKGDQLETDEQMDLWEKAERKALERQYQRSAL